MYHLGQPVDVVDAAIPYYRMLVFSMPFVMLFFAFKQFLEGVGNTKVEMVVTIVANLANIGFNWVFIYGRFSLPEMGAEGAGLGTLLSRIIAPILMVGYFYSRERIPRLPRRILAPQLLVGHGEKTAAHGTADLDADVSRSLGVRRHRHHDGAGSTRRP